MSGSTPPTGSAVTGWARLRSLWLDPEVRQGARLMGPLLPGTAAWALVTGVAMVKVLGVPLSLLMSLVVYAGGSQLAAVPLMAAGAPIWVVWFTSLAVNLRFVVYSLQWRAFFGHLSRTQRMAVGFFSADQVFALFISLYPDRRPQPEQLPRLIGASGALWAVWQGASLVGIVFAEWVPLHWGLEFVGVLALTGLTCSLIRDRASLLSAAVAGLAAVAAYGLPLKLHMVVAIAATVVMSLAAEALGHSRLADAGGRAP